MEAGREREIAREFCEAAIVRLRAVLAKHPPKDSPCSSCAFAAHTDSWKGFENTIYGLMMAVDKGKPFLCHRNMKSEGDNYIPDFKNAIPCANYEAIRNLPEARQAIIEAACAVKDPVGDES